MRKQIDGCAMVGPLSAILVDIHMVRTENEKPINALFYKQFADDIYSKKEQVSTRYVIRGFKWLSPKYKLTIEVHPEKFLTQKLFWTIKVQ